MIADSTVKELGILTDLDTLLDTRFGTVAKHSFQNKTDHFDKLVSKIDDYVDRIADEDIVDITGLNNFQELYEKRDNSTLHFSKVSRILMLIRASIVGMKSKSLEIPYDYKPVLYVNTHPYNLTKEQSDAMQETIVLALGKQAIETKMINVPIDRFSPFDVSVKFNFIYLYHYNKFLDGLVVSENFFKVSLIDKRLVAPAIIFENRDKVYKEFGKEFGSIFTNLKEISEPFIGLDYIDGYYFSVRDKDRDNNLEEVPK
jgi:hypothetical protein